MEWVSRTEQLFGSESMKMLSESHVLVVGVGGVGAYAVEMLVRAGVGAITIVDGDVVSASNINRQLVALHSTIGEKKIDVMEERIRQINPAIKLTSMCCFLEEEAIKELVSSTKFSFVVDAIDTLSPKISLILETIRQGLPIISSMGAGAKSDPSLIRYGDIFDTYHCALAKAVRTRLKKEGFSGKLPVVFSSEPPTREAIIRTDSERNKKSTAGTVSYMPAIFGCMLAAYVINKLRKR